MPISFITGRAEGYILPVATTTGIPNEIADLSASLVLVESSLELFKIVPSMSTAISFGLKMLISQKPQGRRSLLLQQKRKPLPRLTPPSFDSSSRPSQNL